MSSAPVDYEVLYLTEQATIPFAVRNLCIQIAFSSAVFTLYFALLVMSHSHHRKTWTFALVTLVTSLFVVTAFTNAFQLTHSLTNPLDKVPLGIEFTDAFITLTLPWIADWCIFLRAIALIPLRDRKKPLWLALGCFVLVLKVIRLAFLIDLVIRLHREMKTSLSPADLGNKVWPLASSTWVEYGGMLLDTTICASVCAWRLSTLMTPTRSESRSRQLQERLRLLLFNTISSFILPAISCLVMIVLGAVGTFMSYSTVPKINSGVVSINVLIAMLIPIVDAQVSETRSMAVQGMAITDSFLRRRDDRSPHVSQMSGGPPRKLSAASIAHKAIPEQDDDLELKPTAGFVEFPGAHKQDGGSSGGGGGGVDYLSPARRSGSISRRPGTIGSAQLSFETNYAEKTPALDSGDDEGRWKAASALSLAEEGKGLACVAQQQHHQQRQAGLCSPQSGTTLTHTQDPSTEQLATSEEQQMQLRSVPRRHRA
ncbi:hypothetical protein OC845_003152 [Tilletia horrida]|nr:hypothetical protein OC845_003152 [Tilletia horrida]